MPFYWNVILRFVCLFLNDNYGLVLMMKKKSPASLVEWFSAPKDGFESNCITFRLWLILGNPGADKGGEGKSKWAEKYIWNEEK